MKNLKDWNYHKQVRELEQKIRSYETHAAREIENNKVARVDKIRNNSQEYLQVWYKRYRDFTGESYPNPKFSIE